jgi:SSS family solute:Na+ symporter
MDVWWEMAGVFSGGMLGLFLLGLISRRANGRAAAAGVVAGVAVILWMTLSPRVPGWPPALRSPFHGNLTIVLGTLTILVVGWLSSLVTGVTRAGEPTARPPAPLAPAPAGASPQPAETSGR